MQRLVILLVAVFVSVPILCRAGDGPRMAGCGDAAPAPAVESDRGGAAGQQTGDGGTTDERSTVKSSKSNSSERTVKGSKSNSSERGTTVKSGKSNSDN